MAPSNSGLGARLRGGSPTTRHLYKARPNQARVSSRPQLSICSVGSFHISNATLRFRPFDYRKYDRLHLVGFDTCPMQKRVFMSWMVAGDNAESQ